MKSNWWWSMMIWLVCLLGQHPWDKDGEGDREKGDGSKGLCCSIAQLAGTKALLGGVTRVAALLLCALSILEAISGHIWNKQRLDLIDQGFTFWSICTTMMVWGKLKNHLAIGRVKTPFLVGKSLLGGRKNISIHLTCSL
jgi:hypothetical protein